MSEQQNCILTTKDVEGIFDRMKKIQALAKGSYRIYEHCRTGRRKSTSISWIFAGRMSRP